MDKNGYHPVSSNVATGNPLEIGVSMGKSAKKLSIFQPAMFDYRRVTDKCWIYSGRTTEHVGFKMGRVIPFWVDLDQDQEKI